MLIAVICLAGCRRQLPGREEKTGGGEIVVAAAVSLKDAFSEIARLYEARSGVRVIFNFGGSGELEKQIEFGAPADVFASAGEREMDELAGKGLIVEPSRADFVKNRLVLIVPNSSQLSIRSFADLERAQAQRIAIGNPLTVPAGHYAEQALESAGLWKKLHDRLILAEDVRQVLEYVIRGEVDAGLVYLTDVEIAHGKVREVGEAPEGTYGPIRYPIATIRGSKRLFAAKRFVQFVLSADGQNVLKKFGFVPVE
jgi:molybdate transport system substrate-binding protein